MSPRPSDNLLNVHEIFTSIQGEGYGSGLLCTFVRLFGCSVGCSFCDQPQKAEDYKRMSIGTIVSKVEKRKVKNVCITGGEPLMQWNAVYPVILELLCSGHEISVETSGCFQIDDDSFHSRRFNYVMDVKCPSSGVSDKNLFENLLVLKKQDEVKFVVSNKKDYEYMKDVLQKYPTSAKLLVSPCFSGSNMVIGSDLVRWMIEDNLCNVKVQIQMHKVIGVL